MSGTQHETPPRSIRWGHGPVELELTAASSGPACLTLLTIAGHDARITAPRPIAEVLTVAEGRSFAGPRLVRTVVGERSVLEGWEERPTPTGRELVLHARDEATGLVTEQILEVVGDAAAVRSRLRVTNDGDRPVALRAVTSWVSGLGATRADAPPAAAAQGGALADVSIHHGRSDWLGEGRWSTTPATQALYPRLAAELTGQEPRGAVIVSSEGTWSTGRVLPVAAVTAAATGTTWAWQIEHNGPWRWEIGDGPRDGYVALSGPTLADHGWSTVLRPGQSVESVPATVTVAGTLEDAVARLTGFRRAARVAHPDDRAPRLVYNDYMNTLDGDPTTERLLPLVDAAARVGAEVFCIDAGWYDDSGDWWDSVGAWTPSSTRFPGGLGEVIGAIRDRGMIAGLWIEPEVVGVHSPVADELPAEAFLQLHDQRVVEHGRFHLDLRHPAARAHVDGVLDRLVDELGAGYVKMDYNIDPGVGTDRDADSVGEGLLGHCRAVQDVLDGLRARHPALILESCSSGAMRADVAITSRTQLQSTSDQQDPLAYPPIAASAPMSILPEQAANWAYPHPDMTLEQVAFTLTTGLAGRLYLSGFLPRLGPDQLAPVLEAVALYRERREDLPRCVPFWPLGLPGWDDDTVALGLRGPDSSTLLVWDRRADGRPIEVPLPAGTAPRLDQVFPRALAAWDASVGEDGIARLRNPTGEPSAHIFRLLPAR